MADQQTMCDDDELILVLRGDDIDVQHQPVLEHIESCSRCQNRLAELAATDANWQRAASALSATRIDEHAELDEMPRSTSLAASAYWTERPIAWDESMVQRLLDPPSHPEMLGRLGRYEIERLIGSGGMGVVFKAFDTELNRSVAIKILAPYLSGNGSARKRFAREARAAAGVVDDHVVPIHNVESESDPPYLVMQYVAGGSLQEKLDQDGPLGVEQVLRIGMQTAKGLAAAHAQGLIHRDIKPSNVLLDEGVERALLTDFGLARTEDDACLTRSGFHPGTPHYMSPEQVRGETIDARSDLFGLGCLMYALCTGHPPFRAHTSYAVLRRITDDKPRSIREANPSIPEWLEDIVETLLSKSANDRYGSAQEVAERLGQCLAYVQYPSETSLPVNHLSCKQGSIGGIIGTNSLKICAGFGGALLLLASIFITIESNKGTITIESEADDVPIVIKDGTDIVYRRTVVRGSQSIRLHAGEYVIHLDGEPKDLAIDDPMAVLSRGDSKTVKIRHQTNTGLPAASFGLSQEPRVGRSAILTLEGSIAASYLRMMNAERTPIPSSAAISVYANITQRLGEDRFQVEHVARVNVRGRTDHAVSLRAVANRIDFAVGKGVSSAMATPSGTSTPPMLYLTSTDLQNIVIERVPVDSDKSTRSLVLPDPASDKIAGDAIQCKLGLPVGATIDFDLDGNPDTERPFYVPGEDSTEHVDLALQYKKYAGLMVRISPLQKRSANQWLQRHVVTIKITEEDFEHCLFGNTVRKIVFLTNEGSGRRQEMITDSQLEVGADLLAEAERRGLPIAEIVLGEAPRGKDVAHARADRRAGVAESVYNESVQRFTFKLEHVNVHAEETPQEFQVRLRDGEDVDLIAVWADPKADTVTVIAKSEDENAIRRVLAKMEATAAMTPTLDSQKEHLSDERRELLRKIAIIEMELFDLKTVEDEDQWKARRIRIKFETELKRLREELSLIDSKVNSLSRSLDLINDQPSRDAGNHPPGKLDHPPGKLGPGQAEQPADPTKPSAAKTEQNGASTDGRATNEASTDRASTNTVSPPDDDDEATSLAQELVNEERK